MIGKGQRIEAENSGVVIQSGGDTNLSGISSDDVREILCTFAEQLPKLAQVAADVALERSKKFEEDIVSRFSASEPADREAFEDPDFQFTLRDAQKDYVRLGDDDLAERLADLLVARSKADSRGRLALTLRKAIEITPNLTSEEISAISFIFAIRHLKVSSVQNLQSLANFLDALKINFFDKLPDDDFSYSFLEGVGCGAISIGTCQIEAAIKANYPKSAISSKYASEIDPSLKEIFEFAVACGIVNVDESGAVSSDIVLHDSFMEAFPLAGGEFDQIDIGRLRNEITGIEMNDIQLRQSLGRYMPDVDAVFDKWNNSKISRFELNAAGTAIAHNILCKKLKLNAPISHWIK